MDDLVAFLNARLDDDEAAAKAAPGSSWQSFTEDDVAGTSVYDEQWVLLYPSRYDHDNALSDKPGATGPRYIQRSRNELAAHIARHDPARVLREVEAKRKILAEYISLDEYRPEISDSWVFAEALEVALVALAAVYSDHPDYRQEWA